MPSVISATSHGRKSLLPDCIGLHGLGHTSPVVATAARAPGLPAAEAAAVQEVVDGAAAEVPCMSGHDSRGSSAASAGESDVSSQRAPGCRKRQGEVHEVRLANDQQS